MSSPPTIQAKFRRLDVRELKRLISSGPPPLLLDIRRRDAFRGQPEALPHAVPLELDRDPLRLPDVDRERPVVAYCL